jgi:uncharacterized protein (DUF362 family)
VKNPFDDIPVGRRVFLGGLAALAAASSALALSERLRLAVLPQKFDRRAIRRPEESRVAVLRAEDYDRDLVQPILDGARLCGLDARGRGVILKPNLVEFEAGTPINTDPRLVEAAVEAFRRMGASRVRVAEGAGHRRDTELLLEGTGLGPALRALRVPFVDLNLDDVAERRTASWFTGQRALWLPRTLLEGDVLVSMPKLKTHHLAGATLAMKNLFGCVPGAVYGWPKNVLHWWGIDRSIVDLAATLRPAFAIVDGIVGMEGNGPIQGTTRRTGVLVFGRDPVAVDATCARLMGLAPERISYLAAAGAFLGNVREDRIRQAGEAPGGMRQDFELIAPMRRLRAGSPGAIARNLPPPARS